MRKNTRLALRLALIYAVFGILWIALSDKFLASVITDTTTLTQFQTYKGSFYVVITAALVFYLAHQALTQQSMTEEKLSDSEERWKFALEGAGDGVWDWNPQTDEALFSKRWEEMIGYAEHEFPTSGAAWVEHLHPDDKDRVLSIVHEYFAGNQRVYNIEFRMRCKDGSYVWILARGMLVSRDAEGNPIRMIGTHSDITERKHVEENLRITASVFDTTQDAIVITDENNNIIKVNPAFTKITGYNSEEVTGKNPKLLNSGRQSKSFYVNMWHSIEQTKAWRGEIWNRRKSGEVYAELLSISAICDTDGKVLRHVGVISDITKFKEHEAELKHVAHFDALTGIPNRVLLADRMKQAIAQTFREQNLMAVCYLDLDGFKPINDAMGHEAGDLVLVEVARRIGNAIRGGDTVARLGGDEFVVLLLGLKQGEECVTTLERLLAAIALPITVKSKSLTVSASIGVSVFPQDEEDPDILLRHADQAMYVAKQAGKNRFHIYDPELDRRARDQSEFLKSIRYGLEHDQFELYFQPKINLQTKELVGAEALIRWLHPERGLLSPSEFLRFIENTDLDIEVGEWVTATALAQMNEWRNTGLDLEVSINISGYHMESYGFVEKLGQQLTRYPDMRPDKFQIEVLETVALKDITIVRELIESCRRLGVGFALDDFGTGYSSLSYLSGLPIDVLKIDQSFVHDMLEDKRDMAIVQGIIALARAFDLQTVAEGIETEDHYKVLLDMGCELGQGYGIARPMPADKLMGWHSTFRI